MYSIICISRGLFVLILASVITEGSGLQFINKPTFRFLPVIFGANIQLDCRTTDPLSKATLYLRTNPVNLAGPRFFLNGSVFTIHGFTTYESGNYKCVAKNSTGQMVSWSAILVGVPLDFQINVLPLRSSKLAGESFNLTCNISVNPPSPIRVEWQKQVLDTFIKVPKDTTVQSIPKPDKVELVLMFKNAQAMSKTRYRCIAQIQNPDTEKLRTATVTVQVPEPPKIIDFAASKEIALANLQDSTIRCTAQAVPPPTIKWLKNGKELKPCYTNCQPQGYQMYTCVSQTRYKEVNLCLKIYSATYPNDEGLYTCVASNSMGPSVSRSVRAVFHSAPQIDKHLTYFIELDNKPKLISCGLVRGYPLPTFKWLHQAWVCTDRTQLCKEIDDKKWSPLPLDHIVQPSQNTPTLRSNMTVPISMNSKIYKCTAVNRLGQDSAVMYFKKKTPDRPAVQVKATVTIDAATNLTARCIISLGKFTHWLQNNVELKPSRDPRVSMATTKQDQQEIVLLTIVNSTVSDSGLYSCVARELVSGSTMNDSERITVKALLPPTITSFPNTTAYDYFDNTTDIRLTCDVAAHPAPNITWRKSGDRLTRLSEHEDCDNVIPGYHLLKTHDGSRKTLLICDASHETNSGWFSCFAQNTKGSDEKRAYVNILTPPRIQSATLHKHLYELIGQPVNVTCSATGNPQPVVVWKRLLGNGSTVTWQGVAGQRFVARLEIDELDEEGLGNYTCLATNSRGSATMLLDIRELVVTPLNNYQDDWIKIVGAGVGGSLGLILILILSVCCFCHRRNKRIIEEYKTLKYLRKSGDYKIDPDRSLLEQCEDLPYDADWEFPEGRLVFQGVIGSGTFGQVTKAEAVGILSFMARDKTSDAFKRRSRLRRRLSSSRLYHDSQGNSYNRTTVAIKTLKAEATESDYKDLATELKIMIHLGEHSNIINLLGACTHGKQLMVIMEYAPHGNLLNFLRSHREIYDATWRKTANNPDAEFTLADLVMYSYQIARGLDFLSSKKCVHRDVAARNILVGDDYVMKIADFGLARDIYKTEVYVKETSGLLPVKWMAPESLYDREYTQKTDVWSFGIVLWETLTLGGTPYPGLPVEELLDYISDGKRMRQPRDCPPEIYAIMRDCWLHNATDRPTFAELVRRIERILEKKIAGQETDNPYISVFMDEDLHRIYYMEPTDVFAESTPANSTSSEQPKSPGLHSMTEEEITHSPLPPIPYPSLENIHETAEPVDPNYCEPCDNHHRHNNTHIRQDIHPTRAEIKYGSEFPKNEQINRESESSTGVESGIELEDHPSENDDEKSCYRHGNGVNNVATKVTLLDPSVIKTRTRETTL